jgi:uncharacterized RDD family membrane protein YckC
VIVVPGLEPAETDPSSTHVEPPPITVQQIKPEVAQVNEPTKRCPFCAEIILAEAKKCKHCGEFLVRADMNLPYTAGRAAMSECPLCGTIPDARNPLLEYYDGVACRKCRTSLGNRRAGAWILDVIFFFVGIFILGVVAGFFLGLFGAIKSQDDAEAIAGIINICALAIFVTKDGWFQGRSIGKCICGVRVVDKSSGRPVSFGQSFKRNLPLVIPLLPLVAAFQISSGDTHRLGEGWANTKVVFADAKHPYRY